MEKKIGIYLTRRNWELVCECLHRGHFGSYDDAPPGKLNFRILTQKRKVYKKLGDVIAVKLRDTE